MKNFAINWAIYFCVWLALSVVIYGLIAFVFMKFPGFGLIRLCVAFSALVSLFGAMAEIKE